MDTPAIDPVPKLTAADFFRPMQFAPESVKLTTGMDTDHITPDLLMTASKKILGISRGEEEDDDRDSLAFQRIYGPSEYLPEHIQRDGGRVARQLLWKATRKGGLDWVPSGALNDHVDSVFNDSNLAIYVDGANPFESVDNNTKLTRIGEGGIGGTRMAPKEMRDNHGSYMGYIDFIRSPECVDEDTEVLTSLGWVSAKGLTMSHAFACPGDEGIEYHPAEKLSAYRYDGFMYQYSDDLIEFMVTPDHRVRARRQEDTEYGFVRAMYLADLPFDVPVEKGGEDYACDPMKYTRVPYKGSVYCPTVPGGMILIRRNGKIPVWTGNSLRVGLDVFMAKNTRKGSDGKLYTRVTDARTGKEDWVDSVTLSRSNLATPEFGPNGEYFDDKYVPVARGKGVPISYIPRDKIDYYLDRPEEMLSLGANNVPMASASREMRILMGAKNLPGAVPLDVPDRPLVSTYDSDTDDSIEVTLGNKTGVRRASGPGKVTAVRQDRIDVLYDDGTKGSYELYNNFPLNQKGWISSKPKVKAGDTFKPGDILATTNYTTDDGALAPGKNLRGAWISWKGLNYEDAWVVSESAAKAMTSTQMYKTVRDLDKTISTNKSVYLNWKPGEFSKNQLSKLDDNGVVTPGTVLQPGDPIILGMRYNKPAPGSLGKQILTDVSERWEHDKPGVVTDVVRTRGGIRVVTKVTAPLEEGDKISGAFGNKGVVGCYDSSTYVFTPTGFKLFKDLLPDDKVAVLGEDGIARFEVPSAHVEAFYQGPLHKVHHHRFANWAVTPNHRMWVKSRSDYERNKGVFGIERADEVCLSAHAYQFSAPFEDTRQTIDTVVLPPRDTYGNHVIDTKNVFNVCDFAAFMGIWLAEGHSMRRVQALCVTQRREEGDKASNERCDKIEALFTRMGVHWKRFGIKYLIYNKPIFDYFLNLGKSDTKYIPEEVFESYPKVAQQILLDWHYMGDGDKTGTTHRAATVSKQLCDGLQRLHILQGHFCTTTDKDVEIDRKEQGVYTRRNFRRYRITNHVDKRYAVIYPDKMYTEHYEGMVYCVQVSTGVILVQRGGKPLWCGNSILPDDEMPVGADGKPVDIAFPPLGVISRTNVNSVYTSLLGKVAQKRGKPYKIPLFVQEDMHDYVDRELKENNVKPEEDLTDPETGRMIPGVMTGTMYLYKLKHLADSKEGARGTGLYSAEGVPQRGGASGSKRVAPLESAALVGHGAQEILKDSKLIRGQENSDFWRSIQTGEVPTMPGEPLVYKKFYAHLQGSGIGVKRNNTGVQIFTLTDNDTKDLTGGREVRNTNTFDSKHFQPMDGGLFGTDVFGKDGEDWGYIQLDEPLPNPVMEDPIRRVLGLTEKGLVAVLEGKEQLNGMTGGAAIQQALAKINLPNATAQAKQDYIEAPKSRKQDMLKRYLAFAVMERNGVPPDQYMLTRIPVIPPKYRPITTAGDLTMVADSNYLYKQMLEARDDLREAAQLPEEYQGEARNNLYQSWKELAGLYEPRDPKLKNKQVRGLLKWITGSSPKFSAYQSKILTSTVDLASRGVIAPDPSLKLNQVGIPVSAALKQYQPFVVRTLVNSNYTPFEALKLVETQGEKSPVVMAALRSAMDKRPLILNRAPTLHKLGIMAVQPVLRTGHAIKLNPSIYPPFAADNDGDTMVTHVPVTTAAVQEAYQKMLPTKNLIGIRKGSVVYPVEKEYQQGLHLATEVKSIPREGIRRFNKMREVREAYQRNEVDINTPVDVAEKG